MADEKCKFCVDHPIRSKQITDLEKKYGYICDGLNECKRAMEKIMLLEKDIEYHREVIGEIKGIHREAMKTIIDSVKEKIDPLAKRIEWAQRIVYLMFGALVLTVAGKMLISSIVGAK